MSATLHATSIANASKRVVLLFAHGGSYNKDCWKPILRRLESAPLLQRVPCEIASFNWRFHGEKRDSSIAPTLTYRNGEPTSPRVDHPLRVWTEWAPKDLFEEVQKLREDDAKLSRHTHIVGVGHSMGATSMVKVEVDNPGTFDGIIAFEPVYNDGSFKPEFKEEVLDMLVNVSIAREAEWDSYEDLLHNTKTARNFKRWDRECIDAFLENGVEKTEDGKRWRLVVSPTAEAAVYCHNFITLLKEDFAKAECKIILEHAEKTPFFRPGPASEVARQLNGKFILSDAVPNTSHSLVVEDPEACARRILEGFEKFPIFQTPPSQSKL